MSCNFQKAEIRGICVAVPQASLALSTLADKFGEKNVSKIIKSTGISKIRIANDNTTTADYCMTAAKNLLEKCHVVAQDVDGIVFVSQTPDYILPATSNLIQNELGLSKKCVAFDINHGCSGYVYGLFQASLLIESGACNNVLVCVGDTLSRYINDDDRSLKMVMGDAGAATLVSVGDVFSSYSFVTDGSGAEQLIIPAGGNRYRRVIGETDVCRKDEDDNWRSKENLYMNGMEIMNFVLNDVATNIKDFLSQNKMTNDNVDLFLFHQANAFIIKYLAKCLKIRADFVPLCIDGFGNTSSASIPLVICNEFMNGRRFNARNLVCGFGVGLSCATGMISLKNLKIAEIIEYKKEGCKA